MNNFQFLYFTYSYLRLNIKIEKISTLFINNIYYKSRHVQKVG